MHVPAHVRAWEPGCEVLVAAGDVYGEQARANRVERATTKIGRTGSTDTHTHAHTHSHLNTHAHTHTHTHTHTHRRTHWGVHGFYALTMTVRREGISVCTYMQAHAGMQLA